MKIARLLALTAFLVLAWSAGNVQAATPSFTLAASNTTTTTSGTGQIPFTLTSVNGYTGTLVVGCSAHNPPTGAKLPICTEPAEVPTAIQAYPLTANEVLSGNLNLYYGVLPLTNAQHRSGFMGVALAGVLLLGFGLRRHRARWTRLVLVALCLLTSLAGVSACGGNSNGPTSGSFTYAVSATDTTTAVVVGTTITVTVP